MSLPDNLFDPEYWQNYEEDEEEELEFLEEPDMVCETEVKWEVQE